MSKEIVKRKQLCPSWLVGAEGVIVIYYLAPCFEYNMQLHIYIGSISLVGSVIKMIHPLNASSPQAKKEYGQKHKCWGRRVMSNQLTQGDN